jgi:hypothetical protein
MNKKIFITILSLVFLFSSCIKKDNVVFTTNLAELDVAAYNTTFGTLTYPFVTRQPTPGRAILSSADPFITRTATSVTLRVNLTGVQRSTPTNIKYQLFNVGSAVGTSVAYGGTIGTLTTIDAVAGTHFTAPSGICTIPANSSFGTITIQLINSGVSTTQTALVGVEVLNDGDVKASTLYSKVAFAIAQK